MEPATVSSPSRQAQAHSLGLTGVSHEYSGVIVLRDVSLDIAAGEVHGLVGENGSGKSTMIRILTGVLRPTRGTVTIDGEPVSHGSPDQARRAGIGVVHQDYQLFPDLTVAECIFGIGQRLPRRRWSRLVDWRRVEREVAGALERLGIELRPQRLIRTLTAAEWKFVEIARAMLARPRFLILDEATASFEPRSANALLALLERLREQGVGVCFVSHRLDEVIRISDRITVLRDGAVVGRVARGGTDEDRLAELIVGGQHRRATGAAGVAGEQTALRIQDLRLVPERPPAAIDVRRGEILGLVGLVGSGAATVVRMLGGVEPLRGMIVRDGDTHAIGSVRDARRLGIGFIPEDRKGAGLVAEQSVAVNMSLAALDSVSRWGVVSRRRLREQAGGYAERLSIRMPSIDAPVQSLSGGNQQKVLIAKWLASDARVLAIEEPTHGVDVGAKAQIHELLRGFVAGGRSVVLASTDVEEVLELCDRIVVFRHGELSEILLPEALSSAALTARGVKASEVLADKLADDTAVAAAAR